MRVIGIVVLTILLYAITLFILAIVGYSYGVGIPFVGEVGDEVGLKLEILGLVGPPVIAYFLFSFLTGGKFGRGRKHNSS